MPQSHCNCDNAGCLTHTPFGLATHVLEHTPRNMRALRVYSTVHFNELTFHFAGNSTYLPLLICCSANFFEQIWKAYSFWAVSDSLHIRCYKIRMCEVKYTLVRNMGMICMCDGFRYVNTFIHTWFCVYGEVYDCIFVSSPVSIYLHTFLLQICSLCHIGGSTFDSMCVIICAVLYYSVISASTSNLSNIKLKWS